MKRLKISNRLAPQSRDRNCPDELMLLRRKSCFYEEISTSSKLSLEEVCRRLQLQEMRVTLRILACWAKARKTQSLTFVIFVILHFCLWQVGKQNGLNSPERKEKEPTARFFSQGLLYDWIRVTLRIRIVWSLAALLHLVISVCSSISLCWFWLRVAIIE